MSVRRVVDWLGWDEEWERTRPALSWVDLVVPIVAGVLAWLTIQAVRAFSAPQNHASEWQLALVLGTAGALLALRRRHPVLIMVLLGIHFWLVGTYVPEAGYSFVYQLIPFLGLYSGLAWGRDRKVTILASAALLVGLAAWLSFSFAVGRSVEVLGMVPDSRSVFSPVMGAVVFTAITNLIYFFAATLMGNVAWRQARDEADLRRQAVIINEQADDLAENAVSEERLRLARELHDVVAHHIALIGVQAGAARRVLSKDVDLASQALTTVEQASRDAVSQMRGLLGTLRSPREGDDSRAPEPTLAEVPELIDQVRASGLSVSWSLVETPPGAAEDVSLPVGLTVYRIIQEALANVRRHSTARHAQVVVRVDDDEQRLEVEVTDDGSPRAGTSGSGFGQRGIRERVASVHGTVEMRPRTTGGYLVLAQMPTGAPGATTHPGDEPDLGEPGDTAPATGQG